MLRDLNLFRNILVQCEQHEHGFAPSKMVVDGVTEEQIGFHIHLLGQAGLLDVVDITCRGDKSPQAVARALTNDGYDFIEKTRDPDIWTKTQSAVVKLGGWTIATIAAVASAYFQEKLKKVLGSVVDK